MIKPWLEYRNDKEWREYAVQIVYGMNIPNYSERQELIRTIAGAATFDDVGGILFEAEKKYAPNLLNSHFPTGPDVPAKVMTTDESVGVTHEYSPGNSKPIESK
jgi:hypothetical protein